MHNQTGRLGGWSYRRRRGFTLVDTVGMMIAIGMLMSLSAVVLNRALQAHSSALRHFRSLQNLQQFEDRIRQDAGRATNVKIEGGQLSLAVASREIVYRSVGEKITRSTFRDEKEIGRDQWTLPAEVEPRYILEGRSPTGAEDEVAVPLLVLELDFGDQAAFEPIRWCMRAPSLSDN